MQPIGSRPAARNTSHQPRDVLCALRASATGGRAIDEEGFAHGWIIVGEGRIEGW